MGVPGEIVSWLTSAVKLSSLGAALVSCASSLMPSVEYATWKLPVASSGSATSTTPLSGGIDSNSSAHSVAIGARSNVQLPSSFRFPAALAFVQSHSGLASHFPLSPPSQYVVAGQAATFAVDAFASAPPPLASGN